MFDTNINPKAAHSIMKKVFYAVLFLPIIFLVIVLFIIENPSISDFDIQEPLNLALIIITLLSIPAGSFMMRRIFSRIKPDDDTGKRMNAFFIGWLIRLGTYEGVEWFSIIVFLLTGNAIVLLFAVISFLGIAMSYPKGSYIKQSVGINEAELL